MNFPSTCFDYLEERFSYNKVQLKTFCLPVKKSSRLPAENNNKIQAWEKLSDVEVILYLEQWKS